MFELKDNCCFVCDKTLDNINYSDEHIYPRWLQNMFSLHTQQLILLNGTSIKYKSLKVPCCNECNNIMNEKIEKPIKNMIIEGYINNSSLNRKIIFQWLNKLTYGMLYKETMMKIDRRTGNSKSIFESQTLQKMYLRRFYLKSIIDDTHFDRLPCSILIFEVDSHNSPDYWAYDGVYSNVFAIKLNNIGILLNFDDNGNSETYFKSRFGDNLENIKLTFLQFQEITALLTYESSLLLNTQKSILIFNENNNLDNIIPIEPLNTIHQDYNANEYAYVLGKFVNIKVNKVYAKDEIITVGLLEDLNKIKNNFK